VDIAGNEFVTMLAYLAWLEIILHLFMSAFTLNIVAFIDI
jgi:hypothetical protein